MISTLTAQPLTKQGFNAFGDVVEKQGSESFFINNQNCVRHHALGLAEITGEDGRVGISIFSAGHYPLPHRVEMVERHPLGSQAFYPLGDRPWLVIVCDDQAGEPVRPQAFFGVSRPGCEPSSKHLARGVDTALRSCRFFWWWTELAGKIISRSTPLASHFRFRCNEQHANSYSRDCRAGRAH